MIKWETSCFENKQYLQNQRSIFFGENNSFRTLNAKTTKLHLHFIFTSDTTVMLLDDFMTWFHLTAPHSDYFFVNSLQKKV